MKYFLVVFVVVFLEILQLEAGSNGDNRNDRGSWGVSVNKDKGRGPQVRTEGRGNIHTSKDGNWRVDAHGHHEMGRGRKPEVGGGVSVTGRWRRDIGEMVFGDENGHILKRGLRSAPPPANAVFLLHKYKKPKQAKPKVWRVRRESEDVNPEDDLETFHYQDEGETRRKRSFAPGGSTYPSSGGQQGDRGSWGVTVNKDKGRGPQVRTEGQGNIYTSPKGNVRVDGHGHHEMGKGRKPDYGGGVKVQGRWRRDTAEGDMEDLEVEIGELSENQREKRSFAPGGSTYPSSGGQQGDRGSWGVTINKDKGRGPQVRTEGQGNIYTSPKGNVRVDGYGHHEMGKGRKPDYGGGVKVQGRWRRDTAEGEVENLEVEIGELSENQREKRSFAPGVKTYPSSGGQQGDRGSWGVTINKDKGRGPQIRTEGQGNIYKSPDGNVRVDGRAHHEMGKGRKPDYGAEVKVQGRWRRDTDAETDKDILDADNIFSSVSDKTGESIDSQPRVRREANPQKDPKGSVSVSVNKDKGRGPQIRTDVNRNIYTSKDRSWKVDGSAYHEAGKGRRPDYGGRVTLTKSF